ncbi:MAG: 50S ribosomal protein L30 [Candidatus Binatia bacterium]|nr:50S ribosomal protein L30 [Candidatus Binatia bacterium]
MTEVEKVRVRLVRSPIGATERQRATLRALGLKRRGRTVSVPATPPMLGRIAVVRHLVEVEK